MLINVIKMYSAVVTARDITSTLNILLCLNLYSAAEWETLSKPMKAQGEINAIRMTCFKAFLSGRKAGSIVIPVARWPTMAATKQTVMPTVKTSTSTSMQRAVAFLLFMHSIPTSHMTASVARTSPR